MLTDLAVERTWPWCYGNGWPRKDSHWPPHQIPSKFGVTLPPLLSIDKKGYGGTKISTVNPNIALESSIYEAVAETFGMELKAPNVAKSRTALGGKWELHGANWMVEIRKGVMCLAFVDGGLNPRTSIVIGAHHLEDNLLQLDVAASKLGFTSTLLQQELGCANFNF
ncbi:hypothetical protein Acr_03g0018630 [Actinidia rufa]|uniref:Xylanase inhibitor C-terminal domain-containing protein n=1 Tax=Actinidia rufa TaxID=165716 RepID=A0A7J0EGP6_9ERIC|nr:hypothetical protein Acr_03g0018630 [Actinidia rufa]